MFEKEPYCSYEAILSEVFPRAIIERVFNYDDYYGGWDVVISYGWIMQFMVAMGESTFINILARRTMMIGDEPCRVVFRGNIPFTEDGDPDWSFLKKVLKNYKSFAH